MKKRGISPLIATVLLLGFTIALAAVIINWGQTFTKDVQSQTEETAAIKLTCVNEVSFDISTTCQSSNSDLKIVVTNDGTKDIEKFSYRLYNSSTNITTGFLDDPLLPTDLKAFGVKTYLLTGIGNKTKQVELIPIVTLKGKQITCTSNTGKFGDPDGNFMLAC